MSMAPIFPTLPKPPRLVLFLVVLIVLLASLAARAQGGQAAPLPGAGTCGPGKVCSVRRVVASTTGVNGTGAYCSVNNTNSWRWDHDGNGISLVYSNVSSCTGAGVTAMTWNPAIAYASLASGWSFYSPAGYRAPMAFASFPTCNAGQKGVQLFDDTNNVWRYCDGSSWRAHGAGVATSAWTAIGSFGLVATPEVVNFLGAYTPTANVGVTAVTCNWGVAGTGTQDVVMNVTAVGGSSVCSCLVGKCNDTAFSAVGTCACTGTLTANTRYAMQLSDSTTCTANPQQMVCTATLQ